MKPQTALFWAAGIFVGALGADWLACHLLQARMARQLAVWTNTLRAEGFVLRYSTVRPDGFPWGASLTLPDLTLSGGRAMVPGGVAWHAERVSLFLSLLHPSLLTVSPEGEQTMQLAGGAEIFCFADQLNARVKLGGHRPDQVDLSATNLVAGLRNLGDRQDVRIGSLQASLQAARGGAARTSARLSFEANQVGLPDSARWPLGATVRHIDTSLSLASPALSGEDAGEQARAWHDWGGMLTLQSVSLDWGPLALQGAAEIGLDSRLQPEGAGTARVSGWEATLDALSRSGVVQPGIAQTAKIMLALMAPSPDQRTLILPFTLRDDTVAVGKVPLFHIGFVAWGKSTAR